MTNEERMRDLLRDWHMAEEAGQWRRADELLAAIERAESEARRTDVGPLGETAPC